MKISTTCSKLAVTLLSAMLLIVALAYAAEAQNTAGANADANLVQVTATVTEDGNRGVIGLTKENFQIWEDSSEQQIVTISAGSSPSEYVLSYKPTNTAKDGTWRKLQIKVIPPKNLTAPLSVRAKVGYYAPTGTN